MGISDLLPEIYKLFIGNPYEKVKEKYLKKKYFLIFRFINARRRIVQPMIDSNNRAGRPVSVFKNRRRKSSGGAGTPSPVPEGQSPELVNGNATLNGEAASPEDSAANNSSNSGGSNSSTGGGTGNLLGAVQPAQSSLLNFSTPSVVSNPYHAAAAVAAAAVSSNPYAGFGR